jgi:predicted signal transduction protein with EAL and GGDEF domain
VLRDEDTLARLGGDEFTIILKDVTGVTSASAVAQKIINIMKDPIKTKGHTLFISSSIGISIFPDDATTEENLIKFSDTAMYRAKDEGRNNYQFYSSEMTTQAFERVVIENSLRAAIANEEFIVYYQPQYNALNDTIVGMEALVRWNHPQIGLIPPAKFIPIAEESGLIVEIDRIVMKQAMKDFANWYKNNYNPGVLSLNLAMKQLNQSDFVVTLLNIMNSMQFQAKWLELEVTEGEVMHNPDAAINKLKEISRIGVELAIDDFGTGYSSLAYLKKLPLNKLKIDQSFIRDIPKDEDDVAITKAIIALGQSLNLKLIAEGVETGEQKEFLLQNGCHNIQGYFYSRPLHADEITQLLQQKD